MPLPEPYNTNHQHIGSRLIQLESNTPGLVRMCPNPFMIGVAASELKRLGFKKRFLQSPQQFVYDCVLSYQKAIEAILPYSLLAGTQVEARTHLWSGRGQYVGWQGALQLFDFTTGNKDRIVLIVEILPFFDQISEFLDPIKERQ